MPMFGKPLAEIARDNTKLPSTPSVGSDSYLLVMNTANGQTNKMLASEFMKGWDETVATFGDLPDVVANNGKLYLVTTKTGIWPNRKHAGLYVSNGSVWSRLGVLQGILTESTPLSTLSESASITNLVATDTPLTALGKVKKYFADYLTSFNGANQLVKLDASGNMPSSSTLDTITAGTTNKHFTATDKTKLSGIESGATADQTNAEIKTAYEANDDTNAYTDTEKTKLSGIESDATANSTDAELRARSSHTGVQAISTITGLQSALDDKVDDTQVLTNVPENAVFTDTTYTVGDDGLTQKNFTTTLKIKLDGIESGADVNAVDSVAGKTGAVTLNNGDVGLGNVDNKSSATIRSEIVDADIPSTIARDSELTTGLSTKVDKVNGKGLSSNDVTNALKTNWDAAYTHSESTHAPTNAQANVKANWDESDTNSDAFIQNKPTIPSSVSVVDNTSSTSTTSALSVNQGKILADKQAIYQRLRLSSYNMSGGGTITWANNNLSTTQRIIWIPSGNGSGDHWNLNLSNLNVPAWNVAYIRLTESETTSGWTKNQSNVSVTSYVSYVPNDRDLIIGHHNGDNGIFSFASGLNTNVAPNFHTHSYLDMTGTQLSSHMPDYFRMDYDSGWIPLPANHYAWRTHNLQTNSLLIYLSFKNSDGVIFPIPFGNISNTVRAGFSVQLVNYNKFVVFAERDFVFATHYYAKPDDTFEWDEDKNKWSDGHVRVVLKRFTT